jgi:polyisoprenoid-binding protein YceI
VPKFPVATFNSEAITKRSDGRYAAEGSLTVKGITRPVTVLFSYERKGAPSERAMAKGEAVVDRTAFTVGEDSWGKSVAKDVRVTFTVVAEQAPGP